MIKKCPVKINNTACCVVSFDGKDVQLPPVDETAKTVNVKFENGTYSLATEEPVAEPIPAPEPEKEEEPVKKRKKKTIIDEATEIV